ncbi:MAG: hypothetical protein EXR72_09565 [Myxococcales bacterium]|nr:hypothetical protein [Myxococcales bacterium]
MRNPIAFLVLVAATAAGCGEKPPELTVMGQSLILKETDYGRGDYFCPNLANGQFEVILSDYDVCSKLHEFNLPMEVGKANKAAFHNSDNTNMRIIFPSALLVTSRKWVVGRNDCVSNAAPGTEASVFFSHNVGMNHKYDLNVSADSGTITVTSTEKSEKDNNEVTGTYDIIIAGTHLSGAFKALYCSGVVPKIGD